MLHRGICACCGEIALVRLRVSVTPHGTAVYEVCIDSAPCLWRMGEYFLLYRRLTTERGKRVHS